MLCAMYTAAWLYCEHRFIDIWYAVAIYCCMFCAIGTATLYQGHCCLIFCMLCTAACLCHAWALLLNTLYAVYFLNFCAMGTAASYTVCHVLPPVAEEAGKSWGGSSLSQ